MREKTHRRISAHQIGSTLAILASAAAAASPAIATTLRIAEYNIDCSDQGNNNNITSASAGVPTVLAAMGIHKLAGNTQPIDVLALAELLDTNNNNITSTTLPAVVTALNNIYGAGVYAYVNTPDATTGGSFNGPSGYVYNTKTVQVLGAASLLYRNNSSFTNPRAPMRVEFQPIGYGSNANFYMYVSHMKSGTTSTDTNERADEATVIRNDEATLPANSSVIYTGDYNISPPEAVFTKMTAAGQGQAFDPENFTTSKQYWTESTSSLRYRDDYQLMTSNVLNDTGPLDYVTGSFEVFGNNGTTASNGATNAGTNTALGDLPNRTTVLNDLMQPAGSDHMPIVADYGVGAPLASLTWNNTGAIPTNDGITWDINTNFNWNNGANATTFVNGNTVTFNDVNNSHYTITLNTTVTPGSVTVNNSTGGYSISGTGSIAGTASLTKSGAGNLVLSTVNTYTGGTNVTGGVLEITPTTATTSALPAGPVNITGGTLQLDTNVTLGSQSSPTPASNVNITSLSITGSGTLDINNNHIIINYGSGADPIASIAAWIASGFAGGSWTGTGITSTAAQNNSSSYGIGYADSADPGNPAGLASGQIEIMYTLLGDANLDGAVNGSDFSILATNFNKAVSGWDQGDFNYDGSANGADFAALAANFNKGASQSALSSVDLAAVDAFAASNGFLADVPEPASLGLLVTAGIGMLSRRRRSVTR